MYTGKLRIPTNRFCFKCHHRVFHSDVKEYPYVCPHCDENMYRFETYTKRVIVLSKEEAYSAFDMEQETPVFSPRFK